MYIHDDALDIDTQNKSVFDRGLSNSSWLNTRRYIYLISKITYIIFNFSIVKLICFMYHFAVRVIFTPKAINTISAERRLK